MALDIDATSNVDTHHDTTTVAPTTIAPDDHEIASHNMSIDSHNVTIQEYHYEEQHHEVHHGGGGGGGHQVHFDPEVYEIQKHLQEEGFNPGKLDGIMGPQTQRAMMEDEQHEMHQHQHEMHQHQHHQQYPAAGSEAPSGVDASYSGHHHGHAAPPQEYQQQDEAYAAPPQEYQQQDEAYAAPPQEYQQQDAEAIY